VATPRPYVLVHGAWHGGWCWRRVADRLRAAGHRVVTPTLTGLGERAHLLSREVGLETFVRDVVGAIEAEELDEAVLVGHSFGGIPITGAADRIPGRIGHLVYLDALVLSPGESAFSRLPPEVVAARTRAAQETSGGLSLPVPPPSAFGVTDPADVAWLARRLTPHPFRSYAEPLPPIGPAGDGLPRTYVACTDPVYPALESSRARVRGRPGWGWVELRTGHDAMVTAPEALTALLVGIG
jgi:pimeloyl-ACP methyl ester carboxylesterase